MTSKEVGIEEARKRLGDLVTAAQQGADIILTRNGKPAARLTRYEEPTMTAYGILTDYTTGEDIRAATADEHARSLAAGETGAFDLDGRAVFVAGGPEEPTYTVQIQASNEAGTTWQALAPAETVTDPIADSIEQLAQDVAVNQTIADGDNWRVCVWRGADADTGVEPDYILNGESPERANAMGVTADEG